MNMIRPRCEAPALAQSEIQSRHAGLAHDLARAGYLARRRAWRHLRDEYCGHSFLPLAALSGAIADAALGAPMDLIWPGKIIVAALPEHRDAVVDVLVAFGLADG